MPQDNQGNTDPFAEFGGSVIDEQTQTDPFAEFGGTVIDEPVKKKEQTEPVVSQDGSQNLQDSQELPSIEARPTQTSPLEGLGGKPSNVPSTIEQPLEAAKKQPTNNILPKLPDINSLIDFDPSKKEVSTDPRRFAQELEKEALAQAGLDGEKFKDSVFNYAKMKDLGEIELGLYVVDGKPVSSEWLKEKVFDQKWIEEAQQGLHTVEIPTDNPQLAQFLDPEVVEVAQRNINSGTRLGDKWDSLVSGALSVASGVTGLTNLYYKTVEEITGIPLTKDGFGAIEAAASKEMSEDLAKKAEERQKKIMQYENGFVESILKGNISDAMQQGGDVTAASIPYSAAAAALTYTGGPAVAFSVLAPVSSSGEFASMNISEDEKIQGLSDAAKLSRSWIVGTAQTAADMVAGRAIERSFSLGKTAWRGMVRNVAKEAGEEAARGAAEEVSKSITRQYLENMGMQGVEEFLAEGGAEMVTMLTDDLMGIREYSAADYFSGVMEAGFLSAFAGVATTGGLGLPSLGISGTLRVKNDLKKYYDKQLRSSDVFAKQTVKNMQETGQLNEDDAAIVNENIDKRKKAVNAVPADKVEDTETVDLVQEKQQLQEEAKGLDDAFKAPIQEQIREIDAKLQGKKEYEPPKVVTSPTEKRYATVNRNDGKGDVVLTKEEYEAETGEKVELPKSVEKKITPNEKTSDQIEKPQAQKVKEKPEIEDKKELDQKPSFTASFENTEDVSDIVENGTKVTVGDTEMILVNKGDGVVELNKIVTPEDKRGQGSARKALQELTAKADEQGVTLELNVAPEEGTTEERLRQLYESEGFVADEGNMMRREPQKTETPKIQTDAKEQQSGEMRTESKQEQPQGKSDSDLSEVDQAKLQDGKKSEEKVDEAPKQAPKKQQTEEEIRAQVDELQKQADAYGEDFEFDKEVETLKQIQELLSQLPEEGSIQEEFTEEEKIAAYDERTAEVEKDLKENHVFKEIEAQFQPISIEEYERANGKGMYKENKELLKGLVTKEGSETPIDTRQKENNKGEVDFFDPADILEYIDAVAFQRSTGQKEIYTVPKQKKGRKTAPTKRKVTADLLRNAAEKLRGEKPKGDMLASDPLFLRPLISAAMEAAAKAMEAGALVLESDIVDFIVNHVKNNPEYKNISAKVRKALNLQKMVTDNVGITEQQYYEQKLKQAEKRQKEAVREAKKGALKKETKAVRDAVKEAVLKQRDFSKKASEVISEMVKDVKEKLPSFRITPKQIATASNRLLSVNFKSPKSIDRAVKYIEKVFNDAEYAQKLANAKKDAKRARVNIRKGKLGIIQEQSAISKAANLNPEIIPDAVFDKYNQLISQLGQKPSVLNLDERSKIESEAKEIMDSVNEQNSLIDDLSQRYEDYEDKAETYSDTIKSMLKDGIIDADEYELMRSNKSEIVEYTKKQKEEPSEEDIQDAVEGVMSAKNGLKDVGAGLSIDENKLINTFKSISKEDLDGMSLSEINRVSAVIENMSMGFVPHLAQKIAEKIEGGRNAKLIYGNIKGLKERWIDFVSRSKANIYKIFGQNTTAIREKVKRNPTAYIDQAIGSFKNTDIYKAMFSQSASAIGQYQARMQTISKKLEVAQNKLGIDAKKQFDSSAKIQMYLIQKEFESNPNNKEVNSAKEYVEATVKDRNSIYNEASKERLQELFDQSTNKDGELDLKKAWSNMTQKEREVYNEIRSIYDGLRHEADYTASVIRGNRINVRTDYVHIPKAVTGQDQKTELDSKRQSLLNPSTKGKTLIERTGKAKATTFDPFYAANRSANETLLDYYLTPAVKTANQTISALDKLSETKYEKEISDALANVYKEMLEGVVGSNIFTQNILDSVSKELTRKGYQAILSGFDRAAVETVSNLSFPMLNTPLVFKDGVKFIVDSKKNNLADFVLNVGSAQASRLYGSVDAVSKDIDFANLSNIELKKITGYSNEVINILKKVSTPLKAFYGSVDLIANFLVSKPDQLIARPIFFGEFSRAFESITGTSPDVEKISANDKEYMVKYDEAIKQARIDADIAVSESVASNNPFEGIARNQIKPSQSVIAAAYAQYRGFMTRFSTFEYNSALRAVHSMMSNGILTKKEGAVLLFATMSRMMMYTSLVGVPTKIAYDAIMGAMGQEPPEDDETLKQKTINSLFTTIATLSVQRNLGNAAKAPINMGVEYLNKEYGEGITYEGEYDAFRDNIVYPMVPLEKSTKPLLVQIALGTAGPMTPHARTLYRSGELLKRYLESDIEETKQKNIDELSSRIPIEVAGNLGYIPFYRDVKNVMGLKRNAEFEKGLNNAVSNIKEERKVKQAEVESAKETLVANLVKDKPNEFVSFDYVEARSTDMEKVLNKVNDGDAGKRTKTAAIESVKNRYNLSVLKKKDSDLYKTVVNERGTNFKDPELIAAAYFTEYGKDLTDEHKSILRKVLSEDDYTDVKLYLKRQLNPKK